MKRYIQYKLPYQDKLLDDDIDKSKLRIVYNEEFNSSYVVQADGDSRLSALNSYKILNADFLNFIHYNLPFGLHWMELFQVPAGRKTVIVEEVVKDKNLYPHNALFICSAGVSWNIHNTTGFRRHSVTASGYQAHHPSYPPFFSYTLPDVVPDGTNWCRHNDIPVQESYTDCSFVGFSDLPHSLVNESDTDGYFCIISFDIYGKDRHQIYETLLSGLSPWAQTS